MKREDFCLPFFAKGKEMGTLSDCEPKKVFELFEMLCSVPHGSGNTKQISDLCVDFAVKHGLEYRQDELNNVVIVKEASAGYENSEPLILQAHLDMVCAKAPDCPTDMSAEPVHVRTDGEWVYANGTTLGGDNGIGVALILAVLDDDTISHPKIEAVLTVDEETGLEGAYGLNTDLLSSRKMINLDSENDGVLTAGCAGGARVDCSIPVCIIPAEKDHLYYTVEAAGLKGGHSGVDIDKGRANAILLLNRLFFEISEHIPGTLLCGIEGGEFDNVIAPKAKGTIAVPESCRAEFENVIHVFESDIRKEFSATDPDIAIDVFPTGPRHSLSRESTRTVTRALFALPFGVQNMDPYIRGLVRTSLNIGIIRTRSDSIDYSLFIRSSLDSELTLTINKVKACTEPYGVRINVRGSYSGWAFAERSAIRETLIKAYEIVNGVRPEITATHGGLECGVFMGKMKDLDCISCGPDLRNVHSPDEKLNIRSTERLWEILIKALELSK